MVEGRAYTHGTLRAAQRRSERAGMAKLRTARRISSERRAGTAKYGPPSEGSGTLPQKVLARTARARASLRVVAARAPPGAPTLASHGPNVRCKKTNRATQRTNLLCAALRDFHFSPYPPAPLDIIRTRLGYFLFCVVCRRDQNAKAKSKHTCSTGTSVWPRSALRELDEARVGA